MKTLFKNVRVLDLQNYTLVPTNVLVEDDIIAQIDNQNFDADKIIDGKNNLLMSGFVNAHTHNPMTLLRNTFDDCPLQEWLFDNVVPCENQLTPEDVYWGEMLGIAESVQNGITCFEECYFHQQAIIKAVQKSGIRARVGLGKAIFGTNLEQDILTHYKLCKDSKNITNMLYAHSVYAYSVEELETMARLSKQLSLPLSIHLSETLKEVGDCDSTYGKSPVGLLEDVGYFDRPCLCYHGVHCDKDDMQILKNYDVSIATCPSSNIKLASGIAPVYSYLGKGINVCIGTDGPASNNCLDMFKEMYLTATLTKVCVGKADCVGAKDVLKMATINGAKALGFDKVGQIQKGWQADLVLVDVNKLHYQPQNDLIAALVYSGRGSDVVLTMVAGKILYQDGEFFIGENIDTIKQNCQKISQRILKGKIL